MTHDRALDKIVLKNFLKGCLGFFAQQQPMTEDAYMQGYALASNAWIPIKEEMDSFTLSTSMKNDLNNLFNLAEDFFYYVNSSNYTYRSPFLQQKWEEMRQLACKIKLYNHDFN